MKTITLEVSNRLAAKLEKTLKHYPQNWRTNITIPKIRPRNVKINRDPTDLIDAARKVIATPFIRESNSDIQLNLQQLCLVLDTFKKNV